MSGVYGHQVTDAMTRTRAGSEPDEQRVVLGNQPDLCFVPHLEFHAPTSIYILFAGMVFHQRLDLILGSNRLGRIRGPCQQLGKDVSMYRAWQSLHA